jgi:hypothetical protein
MCVVVCGDLVIQRAKSMRRIILSTVSCMAVACFSTLPKKMTRFSGRDGTEGGGMRELLNIKCVYSFSLQYLSE